jgi:hypothetical protein
MHFVLFCCNIFFLSKHFYSFQTNCPLFLAVHCDAVFVVVGDVDDGGLTSLLVVVMVMVSAVVVDNGNGRFLLL